MFSYKFCEISKNTLCYRTPLVGTLLESNKSDYYSLLKTDQPFCFIAFDQSALYLVI